MVNENAIFEIIDQMRIHIPEELKQAKRVQQQVDRLLAQAKEEGERIKGQARQESEDMLSQNEQVFAAQARHAQIIEDARREADSLRQDAQQYAMQVLQDLEGSLDGSLRLVRNGIKRIQSDRDAGKDASSSSHDMA
jgi:cell division septum initiation protein DivIVA